MFKQSRLYSEMLSIQYRTSYSDERKIALKTNYFETVLLDLNFRIISSRFDPGLFILSLFRSVHLNETYVICYNKYMNT